MAMNETHVPNTEITAYLSGDRQAVRYVTGSTVYEEALDGGRWVGLYWSASGQVQRENTTPGLPGLDALALPLHTFELTIDGQTLHNRWEWVGTSQRLGPRPGTVEAVVELRHQLRPVTVKIVTRLDGSSILARYQEITNTGDAPAALGHIAPWSGLLWNVPLHPVHNSNRLTVNPSFDGTQAPFRVGFFDNEVWGEEGHFTWQPVTHETFRIERTTTGRVWGPPYFLVENAVTGQRFFLALAWSGNFAADFSLRGHSHFHARVAPCAPAPLRVLAPGETIIGPEMHIGPAHGTLDDAVTAWMGHIRASVNAPRPPERAMYTVAGRVVEEPGDWILREIELAAEMGVEAFMMDAGWYGDTFGAWPELRGDWTEGDWLPGGMAGIRAYCHERGLLFGLWHEAEAMTKKSRLFAAHPDWQLCNDTRECGETLDLAHPDAARFFEETVIRLIREHQLDFYKLDFNVATREGGQHVIDGFAESEFWRHHEVLYRTYDRARREFPNVCLENCAGGGGRADIGMLARFHYQCVSDWSVHPIAIRAINALTLFIPPEALCYYHNHVNWGPNMQAHLTADADTHLRVTLFALPIFVGFGAQNADRATDFYTRTRRYLDLHKGFCRPVLANQPLIYHHTPDIGLLTPAPWCVLEYAARDRSRGYAGIFKLTHDAQGYLFRPRGIDRAAEYEVTLDNLQQTYRLPGAELARGIQIDLDAALTSELVLYRRVEG